MKQYSFDLFDTCFVRGCGDPENIFDLLAYRVLGDDSSESLRADFAHIRVEGEKRARQLSAEEEITLECIYQNCDFSGLTALTNAEIAGMEMAVEREQLVPVYAVRKRIEELHQRGCAVYYISDMYLPQEFVLGLLKDHGFWREDDRLFLSSAYRKTKRSGTLYRTVSANEGLPKRGWRHYGDHWRSDYIIPMRMGIRAGLISHGYSFYERFLLKQDYFPGFFVNRHMAGISKAVRLSFPEHPQYAFAADLIAPSYVPFVYRLLKESSVHAIKRVFFLARDGYILYRIAKHLQSLFPDIELKYLFVSRSSLYLPGLPSVTPGNLHALENTTFELGRETQIAILSNFVTPAVLDRIMQIDGKCADEDLFSNPDVLSLLTCYHDEQRACIKAYFTQEGVADKSGKVAVVDVRGTCSCLYAINEILAGEGYPPVKGYYLEVFANRKTIREAGNCDALYYAERYRSATFAYLSELGNIFEQYFSVCPCARTVAYRREGEFIRPVFEEESADAPATVELWRCHEEVMRRYSGLFVANKLHLHLSSVIQLSTGLLAYFSRKPLYKYLKALHPVTINNQKNKYIHIVKRISPGSIFLKDISWWRGSVYYTLRTVLFSSFINAVMMLMKKAYHRRKS